MSPRNLQFTNGRGRFRVAWSVSLPWRGSKNSKRIHPGSMKSPETSRDDYMKDGSGLNKYGFMYKELDAGAMLYNY